MDSDSVKDDLLPINHYTTLGGRVTCTQCNALSKRTNTLLTGVEEESNSLEFEFYEEIKHD